MLGLSMEAGVVVVAQSACRACELAPLAHGEATSLPFADRSFIRAKWRRSPDRMSGSGSPAPGRCWCAAVDMLADYFFGANQASVTVLSMMCR
jgi:hypothetical protein